MSTQLNILLSSGYGALIIFTIAAALAGGFVRSSSPVMRAATGIAFLLVTIFITISGRSLLGWTVSAVDRPSFPGFLLLAVVAAATVAGRQVATSAEFRFATMVLAVAGLVLYPAAAGYLDRDTYVVGYSGYLLPAAVALVIAYSLWRKYFITAFALNVAIACFLLGTGESRNLWDYIMDPIAWIIGCGTWIALAVSFATARIKPAKVLAPVQPSSGIGETPISH